MADHVSAI